MPRVDPVTRATLPSSANVNAMSLQNLLRAFKTTQRDYLVGIEHDVEGGLDFGDQLHVRHRVPTGSDSVLGTLEPRPILAAKRDAECVLYLFASIHIRTQSVPRNSDMVVCPSWVIPSRRRTPATVRARIFMSSQRLQFSTYQTSSSNLRSQLKALRPLICAQPVRPGITSCRRRWRGVYPGRHSVRRGRRPNR